MSVPTRYAGAIRTWRSTPTLQHSDVAGSEDEDEAPGDQLQAATRVQFREGASNWVDTPFLQATTFEHERRTPNAKRLVRPRVLDSRFYCKQLASLIGSVKLPRCLHNDRSRL
jgi:hypothetical protein